MKRRVSFKKTVVLLLALAIGLSLGTPPANAYAGAAPILKWSESGIYARYRGSKKDAAVNVLFRNPNTRDDTSAYMSVTPAQFDTSMYLGNFTNVSFQNLSDSMHWGEYGYYCKVAAVVPDRFAYDWTDKDAPTVSGKRMVYRDRLYARFTYYDKDNKKTTKTLQFKLKKANKNINYAAMVFGNGVIGGHGHYSTEKIPLGKLFDQSAGSLMAQVTHYEDRHGFFDSKKLKIEVCVVREFAVRKLFGGAGYVLQKVNAKTGAKSAFKLTYASTGSLLLTRKEMWG